MRAPKIGAIASIAFGLREPILDGNVRRVLARRSVELAREGLISWLGKDDDRPFFAFLNYMEAHRPLIPSLEAEGPVELAVDDLLEGVDVRPVVVERRQVAIHGILGGSARVAKPESQVEAQCALVRQKT